jgi:hypothetical protein
MGETVVYIIDAVFALIFFHLLSTCPKANFRERKKIDLFKQILS